MSLLAADAIPAAAEIVTERPDLAGIGITDLVEVVCG